MEKNINICKSMAYKEKQAKITRENWGKGVYDFRIKQEERRCARKGCRLIFKAQPSDVKKFCSRSCAAKVNNPKRAKINSTDKEKIKKLYRKGFSMMEISQKLGYSYNAVVYWMKKLKIPCRSVSDALYQKLNPKGDPFNIKKNLTPEDQRLFGLGMGIYWGEGNKLNKHSVRLGNSDPKLIKLFRDFLIKICGVKKEKFLYNLLLFNDASKNKALSFWNKELGLASGQIKSVTSLKPRGKGTYKKKSMTGVLTIEVGNVKLKKEIDKMLEALCK